MQSNSNLMVSSATGMKVLSFCFLTCKYYLIFHSNLKKKQICYDHVVLCGYISTYLISNWSDFVAR